MPYLLVWPLANLRHRWPVTLAGVGSVAAVVFVVATLLGFVRGYEQAVERDVDRMGFDLLITARGCPYEAATLMLRGGVGLRYMPAGVVERLDADPAVRATFPTLIHPVRDPGSDGGMMLVKGVTPGFARARDLALREGAWLDEGDGVVLGFEAAELSQRRAGDALLIPGLDEPRVVLGVLERTGSQLDGTVLMRLDRAQAAFGLADRLTGVGVQVTPESRDRLDALRAQVDNEAELQVIALDTVVAALRGAMDDLRAVVRLLAGVMGLLGLALLLNTTLLRSLGEHRRMAVLHAIGLGPGFITGAALVESLLVVGVGTAVGLVGAPLLGPLTGARLAHYLPYAPGGNLVQLDVTTVGTIALVALLSAVVATAPALIRLRLSGPLAALRGTE
jgi:putative ABC transport system permease protein